jgi:hypothetical protein
MRYLITTKTTEPFFSDWFDIENFFDAGPDAGMIVYDLHRLTYLHWADREWREIQTDSL